MEEQRPGQSKTGAVKKQTMKTQKTSVPQARNGKLLFIQSDPEEEQQ